MHGDAIWHPHASNIYTRMTEFEAQMLIELHAIRETLAQLVGQVAESSNHYKAPVQSTNTTTQSLADTVSVQQAASIDVKRYYFGTPDGNGFEECNALPDPNSIRILYVVETTDGINGRFYPLERSMSRLKSNAQTFLLPLCNISKSLDELNSGAILPEQYGEVELENGFWKVTRKCTL